MIKELQHRATTLLGDSNQMEEGKLLLRELDDLIGHR